MVSSNYPNTPGTTATNPLTSDRGIAGPPDTAETHPAVTPVVQDRVRWAPVFAGLVTTIATLVLLSALGAALGFTAYSVIGPEHINPTLARFAAALWSIASALLAFFLGGYVAASTASLRGIRFGYFHGALVWAASIALILVGMGAGLSSLLGGASSNMFSARADHMPAFMTTPLGADSKTTDPNAIERDLRRDAMTAAWTTFFSLLLGAAAATAGGFLGTRNSLLDTNFTSSHTTPLTPATPSSIR